MTISHDDIIRSIEALSPDEMEAFLAHLMARIGVELPAVSAPTNIMGASLPVMGDCHDERDLRLLDIGPDKIAVIKVMRELKGLGLKETRDLVESAPVLVFEGIERRKADSFKMRLTEAGAKVEIR